MITQGRQLLLHARHALRPVLAAANEQSRRALEAVDIVLNELMLRDDAAFYEESCRQSATLAREGAAFVSAADLKSELGEDAERLAALPVNDLHPDVLGVRFRDSFRVLRNIVHAIGATDDVSVKAYLDRVVDWEEGFYAHSMEAALGDEEMARPIAVLFTPERFQDYLRATFPQWGDIDLTEFIALPGGFSKATFLFRMRDACHGERSLVLRVEPPLSTLGLESQDLASEYFVLLLARKAGLPVAEPLWLERDAARLGLRFLVSERMPGENYGSFREAARAISDKTVREAARVLAALSHIHPDGNDDWVRQSHLARWARYPTLSTNTAALVQYWYDCGVRRGMASPAVARAFEWLLANVPQCEDPPSLVHGDFGFHNMLVDDGHVSALLDWEASYSGDPAGDLANLLFGTNGAVDRNKLIDDYHAAGGAPISEYRLRYFDVFNAFKITIGSIAPLHLLNRVDNAPISFAVLGLNYLHFSVARINELIAAAEQCRDGG